MITEKQLALIIKLTAEIKTYFGNVGGSIDKTSLINFHYKKLTKKEASDLIKNLLKKVKLLRTT